MLRLSSKKTLPILIKALESLSFTQTELSEQTKTSIGRVNKVINWLKDKDIIIKNKGKYTITQPNRLADFIASERKITKTRSYYIHATKKQFLSKAGKKAQTCLYSSLERTDNQIPEKNLTLIETTDIIEELNQQARGETPITLYDYPEDSSFSHHPVMIIIDLKTIGKGQEAEQLALQLWRTRQ